MTRPLAVGPLALAPAMADALAHWLQVEAATRDRSPHTITAYRGDLLAFLSFLGGHYGTPALPGTLGALTQSDMRGFAAAERARGFFFVQISRGPGQRPGPAWRRGRSSPCRSPGGSWRGTVWNW